MSTRSDTRGGRTGLGQVYDVYIVEDEESEHIWSEYTDYMWELDKDGKPTDQPVDKKNHYMDTIRYFAYVRNNL